MLLRTNLHAQHRCYQPSLPEMVEKYTDPD